MITEEMRGVEYGRQNGNVPVPLAPGGHLPRALLAVSLLLVGLGGCRDADLPPGMSRRTIQLSEVPETVLKGAKKALPTVNLEEAWTNVDGEGKLHSYEIRGRAPNGKIREARVSLTGEILELE
jgi:hypothetical protein